MSEVWQEIEYNSTGERMDKPNKIKRVVFKKRIRYISPTLADEVKEIRVDIADKLIKAGKAVLEAREPGEEG